MRLRFKSEFAKFMNIEDDVQLNERLSGINRNDPAPIGKGDDFINAGQAGNPSDAPF